MASRPQYAASQPHSYTLDQSLGWTAYQRMDISQEPSHDGAPSSTSSYPSFSHGSNLDNDRTSTGVSTNNSSAPQISGYSAFLIDDNENFTPIASSSATLAALPPVPHVNFGADFDFEPSNPWDCTTSFNFQSPFSIPDSLLASSPSLDFSPASFSSSSYSNFSSPDISMVSESMPPTPHQDSAVPIDLDEKIEEVESLDAYSGRAFRAVPEPGLSPTINPALLHSSSFIGASSHHHQRASATDAPLSHHSSSPLPFPQGPFSPWLVPGFGLEDMRRSPVHTQQRLSPQPPTPKNPNPANSIPSHPTPIDRAPVNASSSHVTTTVNKIVPDVTSGSRPKRRVASRSKDRVAHAEPVTRKPAEKAPSRPLKRAREPDVVSDDGTNASLITNLLPPKFIPDFLTKAVADNVGNGIECEACKILPNVDRPALTSLKTFQRHMKEKHLNPIAKKYRKSRPVAPIEEAFIMAFVIVHAKYCGWADRKSTIPETPPFRCSPQCAEEGKAFLSNYRKGSVAKDAALRIRLQKLEAIREEVLYRSQKIWRIYKCEDCRTSYSRRASLNRHKTEGTCKGPKGNPGPSPSAHVIGTGHPHPQAQDSKRRLPLKQTKRARALDSDEEDDGSSNSDDSDDSDDDGDEDYIEPEKRPVKKLRRS